MIHRHLGFCQAQRPEQPLDNYDDELVTWARTNPTLVRSIEKLCEEAMTTPSGGDNLIFTFLRICFIR